MKSLLLRAFGLLLVLALLGAIALGVWLQHSYRFIQEPYPSGQTTPQAVTTKIERGVSAAEILERLETLEVIPDARLARLYLVHLLDDPPLKAGEYRFERPLSTLEVLAQLVEGRIVLHPVTVIEGLTYEETAEQLAAAGFGELELFLEEMSDPSRVLDLDPEATSLEGYLFPDTYSFADGATAEEIVSTLVRTFRQKIDQRLFSIGDDTDLRSLVTLASIIEKEASMDSERATIAGVYAHRLKIGMGLYADPTVIYAIKIEGRWDGNIRSSDLEIDSPYNTYRYPGLPPGPICSPGLASLQAAAEPEQVPYLYFVSRNDGSHAFARTLSEHNRNVDEWQRRYWRERR